ncbi:c-type cytochrome biogenesis protein CcmI, partial [Ameyamaea chiangmaiensis]|nr:c-type cytochrome biogenesis protein CcmI [Ameyamaea chiangmaiensis]
WRVWVALTLIPVAALALYLTEGHPSLPAQPLAPRHAAAVQEDTRTDVLLTQLRAGLDRVAPTDPNYVRGYLLLGQAEAAREHYAAAAAAWHKALDQQFDPELAARTAEAQTRADGRVSADSAALFRRALDAAPKDAEWRMAAEQRIAESEHGQ